MVISGRCNGNIWKEKTKSAQNVGKDFKVLSVEARSERLIIGIHCGRTPES